MAERLRQKHQTETSKSNIDEDQSLHTQSVHNEEDKTEKNETNEDEQNDENNNSQENDEVVCNEDYYCY